MAEVCTLQVFLFYIFQSIFAQMDDKKPFLCILLWFPQTCLVSMRKGFSTEMRWTFIYFIYSFRVLRRFQQCTGHITMGRWQGRGNQYIQLVKVLYCKLLTNGKQLPAFPLEVGPGTEPRPQRWDVRVLPLCHCG